MADEAAGLPLAPVALQKGTDMLETFLSLMPDAALAVDGNGMIVAVNSRTEAYFGYSPGELEGKPIEALVPERFRHSHRKLRAGYSAEPRARPMGAGLDLYARRRDGSEFPVDISLAPIGDENGSLVVAAIRDITERKAALVAQEQLAAIVESSGDAIFSITTDGVITSWNPAAQSMFGYKRPDVLGHHISQFLPNDPVFEELLDAAGDDRQVPAHDTCWQTEDGHPIDVAVSVSRLGGRLEGGYSVLARDIGARKAAEALLRRQARFQSATAEIRLSLLSGAALDTSLNLICNAALDLSGAPAAALVVANSERVTSVARAGDGAALAALEAAGAEQFARSDQLESRELTSSPRAGTLTARSFPISFPKSKVAPRSGALIIVMRAAEVQLPEDVDEVLSSIASQALLAFELDSVRSERDRLLISADRERIARDLHDLVIQRLFGAGLRLQGALGLISDQAAAANRVSSTIDDLDTTIKEIREAIFALESPPGRGLRAKVLEAVSDASETLGFRPEVSFEGDVDDEDGPSAQLEAVAVLREALSNAARHAHASRVQVYVRVSDELEVVVVDNGVGLGEPARMSGIANAQARAELLGGHLDLSAPPDGGTIFAWRVPI